MLPSLMGLKAEGVLGSTNSSGSLRQMTLTFQMFEKTNSKFYYKPDKNLNAKQIQFKIYSSVYLICFVILYVINPSFEGQILNIEQQKSTAPTLNMVRLRKKDSANTPIFSDPN